MGKIKINLAGGTAVEKPLVTCFKGTMGDYLILDNEANGSMGLPIICISRFNGNSISKITDKNEWDKVKENLKTIISGTALPYLNVPESLSAEDDFFTQLTLPVISFDTLKNAYKPVNVAEQAIPTPMNVNPIPAAPSFDIPSSTPIEPTQFSMPSTPVIEPTPISPMPAFNPITESQPVATSSFDNISLTTPFGIENNTQNGMSQSNFDIPQSMPSFNNMLTEPTSSNSTSQMDMEMPMTGFNTVNENSTSMPTTSPLMEPAPISPMPAFNPLPEVTPSPMSDLTAMPMMPPVSDKKEIDVGAMKDEFLIECSKIFDELIKKYIN